MERDFNALMHTILTTLQTLTAQHGEDAAYFTPSLPVISLQSCHPFQRKAASDFTPILPPW